MANYSLAPVLRRRRAHRTSLPALEREVLAWQQEPLPSNIPMDFPWRWRADAAFSAALEVLADMMGIDPPGVDMPAETARWLASHLHKQPAHIVARALWQAGARPQVDPTPRPRPAV